MTEKTYTLALTTEEIFWLGEKLKRLRCECYERGKRFTCPACSISNKLEAFVPPAQCLRLTRQD